MKIQKVDTRPTPLEVTAQEILTKVLGYSAAEIAEIKGSGAITPAEKGARAEAA